MSATDMPQTPTAPQKARTAWRRAMDAKMRRGLATRRGPAGDAPPPGAAMGPLQRFARDGRGVAAVEFALILPVMVTLWLGATDLTFAHATDRRVALAANAMADLVARQRLMDAGLMTGIMEGGKEITFPDSYAPDGTENPNLKFLVTSVEIDSGGAAEVLWSEGHNRAGLAEGSAIVVDDNLKEAGEEGCVVLGQVELTKPVLFLTELLGTTRTMEHTFAYRPRATDCVLWQGPPM